MSLEIITDECYQDDSVEFIVNHHFNGNGQSGIRSWLTNKFGNHVRASMEWMRDRKLPDDRILLSYLNYAAKWATSYGFVSWALGDQRPTRQRQIAKAINLKRDYLLTTGNVIIGSPIHITRVYEGEGLVIAPVASYFISSGLRFLNFNEAGDFVDKHAREMWLAGYFTLYAIPRLVASLAYKKPSPGIGIKTALLWVGIEGKKGMRESYDNTRRMIKDSYGRLFS